MNKSITIRSFIILLLLYSFSTLAGPGFRVVKVIGNASLINDQNEAKNLSQGVFLPTNAKIMVSKGSQLTFTADTGSIYHLSETSAVEIWREQLVLLSGTLWVQSPKEDKDQNIETMNSIVNFKKSEFVLSFDDIAKKSQVFVISGHAAISNIFMKEKKELLVSGEISFVQKDFQQGMPRRAALIGNESLVAVFSKFKGVKPGDENFQSILNQDHPGKDRENFTVENGGRSIASVPGEVGGIYFLPKSFSAPKRFHPLKSKFTRVPASVGSSFEEHKVQNSKDDKRAFRPIRVFNLFHVEKKQAWSQLLGEEKAVVAPRNIKKIEKRQPASVKSNIPTQTEEPDFDALMKELKNVSPHHNEVY